MIFYALVMENTGIYLNFQTNNAVIWYLNDNEISYIIPLQSQKRINL